MPPRPPPPPPLFPYTTLFRSASLADPVGYSQTAVNAIVLGIGILSLVVPAAWLLGVTRLGIADLRIARPPQWSAVLHHCLFGARSEEHTSELQSRFDIVCRLL